MAQALSKPSDSANGAFNEAIMEFVLNKRQQSVYVYATVGDADIFDAELPRFDRVKACGTQSAFPICRSCA